MRILLILVVLLVAFEGRGQHYLFSLDYRYTKTKYVESKSSPDPHSSLSKQYLAGFAIQFNQKYRLGTKVGVTQDVVYSSFNRQENESRTNLQVYIGIYGQKRVVSVENNLISLWFEAMLSAEPFISRKSLFIIDYPVSSDPNDIFRFFEGVYTDKRTRFSVTPVIRVETKIKSFFSLSCFAGYSFDLQSSNIRAYSQGAAYNIDILIKNYAGPPQKESYLLAGGTLTYILPDHK